MTSTAVVIPKNHCDLHSPSTKPEKMFSKTPRDKVSTVLELQSPLSGCMKAHTHTASCWVTAETPPWWASVGEHGDTNLPGQSRLPHSCYNLSFLYCETTARDVTYSQASPLPVTHSLLSPLLSSRTHTHAHRHVSVFCFLLTKLTAHFWNTRLFFFQTREPSSPNDAWNKIVTRVPMKANKTSHYRDEKVYHYHGNWEAHSQRAGWVTNKERVKEKKRKTGIQERGKKL